MKAIIVGAIVVCLGLIGLGAYVATRPVEVPPRVVPMDASYTQRVKDGGWSMGSTNPKNTLVEFADFQCPYCAEEASPLKDAMAQVQDTTKLIYRQYPLTQIHDKATQAAIAAEAAGRQGKFWQMHDLLFANQTTWEPQSSADFAKTLEGYAKSIGLNMTQYSQDLADPSTEDQITKDTQAGDAIHLTGTPTLVLNGKTVASPPTTADGLVALLTSANAQ